MIGNFMTKYVYQKINYVSLIIVNENNDLFVSQRSNKSKPMNGYFQPIGERLKITMEQSSKQLNEKLKRKLELM